MNGKCMYKDIIYKASIRYNDKIKFLCSQLQIIRKIDFVIRKLSTDNDKKNTKMTQHTQSFTGISKEISTH